METSPQNQLQITKHPFFTTIFGIASISWMVIAFLIIVRYQFFIRVYVIDAIWIMALPLFFLAGLFGFAGYRVHRKGFIKKFRHNITIGLVFLLMLGPAIGIGYMEEVLINGELNLTKLARLYDNQAEWEQRVAILRQGFLQGATLFPLPARTPLNATIHDTRIYEGYAVSNVYFESFPGFFVSGNLYQPYPVNNSQLKSVILVPHGHFPLGRFEPDNQALAATLARMGAYAMTYDMVGRGESQQYPHHAEYTLTLQTWDSIRVLDFMLSLPMADPSNVGVTGASGGGTQSFFLAAVDTRIKVSAPVVMVSSWMFGGCECESGLPVHEGVVNGTKYSTNNAEIAAMNAPKPLILVSDGDDWTKFNPTLEYPFIQRIYSFYGEDNMKQNLLNVHLVDEKHDYGPSKRNATIHFFAQHMPLNLDLVLLPEMNGINESAVIIETPATMAAYTTEYPLPSWAISNSNNVIPVLRSLQNQ
jgi:hypothetical protein